MHENGMEQSKRWVELAQRAYQRSCYTYTEFLSPAEQGWLAMQTWTEDCAPYVLWGGYPQAERKVACFGQETICGYQEEPPVRCLEIAPVSARFADSLGHRDFLGSVLALGLRRQVLGDILVVENRGYLFCLEHVVSFILEQLQQVKHTTVHCSLWWSPPPVVLVEPEPVQLLVASERLDGIMAAVYKLSRNDSQQQINQGRVLVNDREIHSVNLILHPGDRVSVRGKGRFRYEGIEAATRKGRLRIRVRVW